MSPQVNQDEAYLQQQYAAAQNQMMQEGMDNNMA